MDKQIKVPYVSQYQAVQEKYFALTSCGMVSMYMVLLYFKSIGKIAVTQGLEEMITIGRETDGGYQQGIGWIHDYFVTIAQEHCLHSYRKEMIESLDEIIESLNKDNPVVISTERRCLSSVSFHMVVLTGLRTNENNDVIGFFYNDPAMLIEKDGVQRYCTREDLLQYWRAKAIFFSAKKKNKRPHHV
jgi:uncharacterized protein YvpB